MTLNLLSVTAVFAASAMAAMGLGGGSVLLLYLSLMTTLPQTASQAINLLLFVPAAALSLLFHWKNGLVSTRHLKACLPGGIVGGILGSLLGNSLDPSLLKKLFGVFLLVIGVRELWLSVKLLRSGNGAQTP